MQEQTTEEPNNSQKTIKQEEHELIDTFITRLFICNDILAKKMDVALKSIAINRTQLSILYHMGRSPETSISASSLAEVMSINQPGISKAIQNLTTRQFVEKCKSQTDSRITELRISNEGIMIIKEAQQIMGPLIGEVFNSVEPSILQDGNALLLQLMMNLQTQAIDKHSNQ